MGKLWWVRYMVLLKILTLIYLSTMVNYFIKYASLLMREQTTPYGLICDEMVAVEINPLMERTLNTIIHPYNTETLYGGGLLPSTTAPS